MIKSIDIQNYLSHANSRLEFHKGVNVIIGASDKGKTAVIRALRWVVRNKPSGGSIRSWWDGKTSVRLEVEEGFVSRSKDKQDLYIVSASPGKKHTLKAFGVSVPEEVSGLLNIGEVNLQMQLDSHFLLSKSSGEVASYFNKVARLDKIDTSQKNIRSWIRVLKFEGEHTNGKIKEKTEELKKFEPIDKIETQLEVVEDMESRLTHLKSSRQKLVNLINQYEINRIEFDRNSQILILENPVDNLLKMYKRKEEYEIKYSKLLSLINLIRQVKKNIRKVYKLISLEGVTTNLLELYNKLNTVKSDKMHLEEDISNLKYIHISLKEENEKKARFLSLFNKEFPDTCPLCGTDIPHDHHLD